MIKTLNYLDLIIFNLLLIANEILLRYFCLLPLFTLQALLFDLGFYLLLSGILILFNKKIRKVIEGLLIFLSSVYSFAQSFHYAYFKTLFSFRKLSVGGEFMEVLGEIFDKFDPRYLLFLLPLIIILMLKINGEDLSIKHRTISFFAMEIGGLIFINALTLYLSNDYAKDKAWQKDYYLLRVMQNKNRYLTRFGLAQYMYRDLELSFQGHEELSDEEMKKLDAFVKEEALRNNNAYSGLFAGKNLIMILCESFDESAITADLTPTLYRLKNEGLYFDNYYAPVYQVATGDSEFIAQSGMMPSIDYGTTSYTFHLNHYPGALANLFKEKGYNANSYHSYISNFYNREALHESFGFETFYDMDKLGLKRFEGYSDTFNWLKDEELFAAMLENTDFNEPFYNFVITASGHMPYRTSRQELKENLEFINQLDEYKDLDNESKCYYAAQMLLDQGLEVLIEGLESRNELEDTVIMLFSDHYPYGIASKEANTQILKDAEGYEIYRVPLIIYNPKLQAKDVKTLSSTLDIYPTVANIFNLEDDKYYKAGTDVFDEQERRFVLFEDGSILAEKFYYDATDDTIEIFKNYHEGEAIDDYHIISQKAVAILKYSQEILIADYYKEEDE